MSLKIFHHQHMKALSVTGQEAGDFLNDLLTAQIQRLDENTARMACLLSPQGRILFDMLIVRKSEDQFICITEAQQLKPLLQRLMMYRLRRPIQLEEIQGVIIGHCHNHAIHDLDAEILCRSDERHPALGILCLIPDELSEGVSLSDDADWEECRIKHGIPQTAQDLIPNRALMLEAGLEHLGAIDFKKGCYIGQEVTARTHYRGLVKRRIVPITAAQNSLTTGHALFWQEKEIGCILSVNQNGKTALSSLRLDAIAASQNDEAITDETGQVLSVILPEWMQPLAEI